MKSKKKYWIQLPWILVCLALTGGEWGGSSARAQGGDAQIIQRLREIIREAEQKRAADRWLLDELRGLVRHYDWPWGVELLRDDFSDGDFIQSPNWTVAAGRFDVDPRIGLQTYIRKEPQSGKTSQSSQHEKDAASAIVEALLDRALKKKQKNELPPEEGSHAEIYVRRAMPNTFAIRLDFGSRRSPGRLVFGPYDGSRRDRGYRLAYNPGDKNGLELYRATHSGTSLVASYKQPVNLEDGRYHTLEWTRDKRGNMAISVDGKKLLEASDQASMGGFNGFTLVNFQGDFVLREIVVFGER